MPTNNLVKIQGEELEVRAKVTQETASWPLTGSQIPGKGFKPISKATKKKRINFRLRKLITPKAPVMVLNEMVGAVTYTFVEPSMVPVPGNFFTAQCEVSI